VLRPRPAKVCYGGIIHKAVINPLLKTPALLIFTGISISLYAQTAGLDPALLAKANGGEAAAQVQIGEKYAAGTGVAQDYKQAADWYRKAAEQGNVAAEIHLADAYRDGEGLARDKEQAATWYRKAADQGDPGAQGTLGTLYTYGQGVPQSDVDAYFWFDLAAAVKGPKQARYIANRQNVGTRITADELAVEQERAAKWKAAHPRSDPAR
jgi:hypothetical protein